MTSKFSLLAGASVGIAMIAAGPALARPVKHSRHAAAHRSSGGSAEIEALKAQVEALTARLDAQEQNAAQATAQINQAQSTAAAAQMTATQAQTTAAATQTQVPTEVKTQLASMPKPKNAWANDTVISGRMYFNFSNVSQKVNGVRTTGGTAGNGTGFDIKRMYLGIDHTFSPIFSANLTMDASNVVGSTSNYNFNGNSATAPANSTALVGRGFYIKKAYLQAKLNPALIIRLGAADLPWIPFIENQYGYRHIENTLIDRTGFGTSADWGIHVLGDIAGGLLSYQFSAIDGGGYRNVKVTKSVDFEGRVSTAYKGFFAGVGGYSGKHGNDTQGLNDTLAATGGHLRNATRLDAAAGYKNKMFTIGGEYFHTKNWNNPTTEAAESKADGWTAFGNVNFAKTWSVFGRYDWVKPNKEINDGLKEHYYNAGIQWEPVKIVDLALVYKHETLDNGNLISASIGNQNAPGVTIPIGGHAINREIGLYGQLRF
jgi:type II secretory pathway pseudopilin PulG